MAQLCADAASGSCQIVFSTQLNESIGFLGVYTPQRLNGNDFRYCTRYENLNGNFSDRRLYVSRIFALLGVCISGVVMLASWSMCCCGWSAVLNRAAAAALLGAALSQGLSFLIASSSLCSKGCNIVWGGGLSMVATVIFFGLSLVFAQVPGIKQIQSRNTEKDEQTEKMNAVTGMAEDEYVTDTV